MRESSAYELIRYETAVETGRKFVLRFGSTRFGAPGSNISAQLQSITDPERFERLADGIHAVNSWSELLEIP